MIRTPVSLASLELSPNLVSEFIEKANHLHQYMNRASAPNKFQHKKLNVAIERVEQLISELEELEAAVMNGDDDEFDLIKPH